MDRYEDTLNSYSEMPYLNPLTESTIAQIGDFVQSVGGHLLSS